MNSANGGEALVVRDVLGKKGKKRTPKIETLKSLRKEQRRIREQRCFHFCLLLRLFYESVGIYLESLSRSGHQLNE